MKKPATIALIARNAEPPALFSYGEQPHPPLRADKAGIEVTAASVNPLDPYQFDWS